jgi:hypothetical protein
VDNAQERRVAENEALSREINELIEAHSPGERRSPGTFLCECGRQQCDHIIDITPRDYERVRGHPRRFIVRPGHEEPDAETVVEAYSDYVVVEKQDEAGRVAEDENPRG